MFSDKHLEDVLEKVNNSTEVLRSNERKNMKWH